MSFFSNTFQIIAVRGHRYLSIHCYREWKDQKWGMLAHSQALLPVAHNAYPEEYRYRHQGPLNPALQSERMFIR